jgi:hypothetical protein
MADDLNQPAPVDVGFDAAPADEPKRVREIPAWLVSAVVLACAGGAAWFVWTNWLRSGPAERIVILDRGPDDGVKPAGPGRFDVRSGSAGLTVTRTGGRDADLAFRWVKQEYLSADEKETLTVVMRLVQDAAMAAAVQATPDQVARLKANRARAKVQLAEPDRERLKELFLAYDAETDQAARRAAETKLIKALDAVAAQMEGAARRTAAERTAEAKKILTPEQFQRFKAIGQ